MSSVWYLFVCVAAVVLAIAVTGMVVYFVVKRYFDNQQKQQILQMKMDERKEALKMVTPIRLQAYERMALFWNVFLQIVWFCVVISLVWI